MAFQKANPGPSEPLHDGIGYLPLEIEASFWIAKIFGSVIFE